MHLVPADRQDRRILEGERVCSAIGAVTEAGQVAQWAELFGIVADQSRLTLLLCIASAGPISVTDLAVAADMYNTTVSHALRLLRAAGAVAARRDGRIVRYELADERIGRLLELVSPHQ